MKLGIPHKIEKSLQSIEGMQRAEASPFLFGKIMGRIKQNVPEPIYYTTTVVVRFALAVLIVGMLNGLTVSILKRSANTTINENEALMNIAQEYFGEQTTQYIY